MKELKDDSELREDVFRVTDAALRQREELLRLKQRVECLEGMYEAMVELFVTERPKIDDVLDRLDPLIARLENLTS